MGLKKLNIYTIILFNSFVMSASQINQMKFTWCLSTYGQTLQNFGYNITGIRECPWGHNCNNAHSLKELSTKKDILKWYKKSKADINLLDIKENILHVMNCEKSKVKNQKYKSKINHINDMNLIELLNFWFDITCYHRKISKMLKQGHSNYESYYKIKDVPCFYLNDEEDVWSLQRTLNRCEKHFSLRENHTCYYIKDICVGHLNCKNGVHRLSDLACTDDLIKGYCDCPSKETIASEKEKIQIKINEINNILENSHKENKEDNEGFTKVLSKSKKQRLTEELNNLKLELNKLNQRKFHYTELGLICYNDRVKEKKKNEPKEINFKSLGNKKAIRLIKK